MGAEMDFGPPRPRRLRDGAVPMINVVFLLLVFFLLTPTLAERAPLPVDLPESRIPPAEIGDDALYVAADGRIAWREARGEAVYDAIAAAVAEEGLARLDLRADRALPGPTAAAIVARLGAAGVSEIALVVGAP